MITAEDIKQVEEIQKILENYNINAPYGEIDWSTTAKIDLLDKMAHNLQIAKHSYRPASDEDVKNSFFTAQCDKCGWWGSSKLLLGGGQIADTGDYGNTYCPVCGYLDCGEIEELPVAINQNNYKFVIHDKQLLIVDTEIKLIGTHVKTAHYRIVAPIALCSALVKVQECTDFDINEITTIVENNITNGFDKEQSLKLAKIDCSTELIQKK
jgi:hypothetical protein